MARDLLIELGTEEIPARMLADIARQFGERLRDGLAAAQLLDPAAGEVSWTPRRLVFYAPVIAEREPDREEEVLGPPARIAFAADGSLTPQAAGFAAKVGCPPDRLYRAQTAKGEYIAGRRQVQGRAAADVLHQLVPETVRLIELPKAMQWQGRGSVRFIRPIRWLVVLEGDRVVPVVLGNLTAYRETHGHRTLGAARFELKSAGGFAKQLAANHVIVAPGERRRVIERGVAAALNADGGARRMRVRPDDELLETLVNLTEFPGVIRGEFDPAFLDLPAEVLVTVMRDHQKYFAVEWEEAATPPGEAQLAPSFLAVMNLASDSAGLIRHGNERVLRARFNDARFFWQADLKRTLEARVADLNRVTFQARLGSYGQKTERMTRVAEWLIEQFNRSGLHADRAAAARAARLSKSDLTTELVKEFTELQGQMGGLYARRQGEPDAVAWAIYDQYRPLAIDSAPPRSLEGAAVALADKADTIVGMFAIGELPSGSRDPFALRRAANGIVAILAHHKIRLDLRKLLEFALEAYADTGLPADEIAAVRHEGRWQQQLADFFAERMEFYLREVMDVAHDEAGAILAASATDVFDAVNRSQALAAARRQRPEDFARIAEALKRMRNIVRKEGGMEQWAAAPVNLDLLIEPEERRLRTAIEAIPHHDAAGPEQYERELVAIAGIWETLDQFFNRVRVNAEDPKLRSNRLGLLAWAVQQLSRVADFSEIVIAGEGGE